MVTGNILQFVEFEPTDQGSYVCVGYGGGVYSDVVVQTSPAVVVFEGMIINNWKLITGG